MCDLSFKPQSTWIHLVDTSQSIRKSLHPKLPVCRHALYALIHIDTSHLFFLHSPRIHASHHNCLFPQRKYSQAVWMTKVHALRMYAWGRSCWASKRTPCHFPLPQQCQYERCHIGMRWLHSECSPWPGTQSTPIHAWKPWDNHAWYKATKTCHHKSFTTLTYVLDTNSAVSVGKRCHSSPTWYPCVLGLA